MYLNNDVALKKNIKENEQRDYIKRKLLCIVLVFKPIAEHDLIEVLTLNIFKVLNILK